MKKIKIGFVGAGIIARAHRDAFGLLPECELVGVCDPNVLPLDLFVQQAPDGMRGYPDCAGMLRDAKPDALVVCTPPNQREEALSLALSAGCSVLMEKPLAHSVESAERMVKMVEGASGVHSIGFCHRFVPAVCLFKEMIACKEYGELVCLHNTFGGYAPGKRDHWMSDPHVSGGGILMDVACHCLDISHFLCGEIHNLKGAFRNSWLGRGEDTFMVVGEAESGALIQLGGSWSFSNPESSLHLRFERADLKYDYADIYHFKEPEKDWREISLEAHANVRFLRQAQAFVGTICGRIPTHESHAASFRDGLLINQELAYLYAAREELCPAE